MYVCSEQPTCFHTFTSNILHVVHVLSVGPITYASLVTYVLIKVFAIMDNISRLLCEMHIDCVANCILQNRISNNDV